MSVFRGVSFCAVFFLALACSAPIFAAVDEVEERTCTVTGAIGSVQVRYNPEYKKVQRARAVAKGLAAQVSGSITYDWTPLRQNMVVGEKCEIMTGPESELRLETADGTVLRVEENTHIEVAQLQAVTKKPRGKNAEPETSVNARFKVIFGNLIGNVKKLTSEKPNVRFETPTATAAIRGTVIEIEASKNANTVIRAFDGTILVAPAGREKYVEVSDNKMVEVAPKQKAIIVRDIPKGYKRKGFRLKGEGQSKGGKKKNEKPIEADDVAVKLRLDLGDVPDTLSAYVGDTLTMLGHLTPPDAKLSVNGVIVKPDSGGAFAISIPAPESGVFPLNIIAESETMAEAVIRTLRVAHVHTAIRLITPAEGAIVNKPKVRISGTAEPGSKVNALGVTLTVNRDGTFSGEVGIPPREGNVKIQVEIVNREDNAVWIERNIRYKK
ncbi:MAG: FecR domain-containing protein [Chitinispirillales bacterium]|jgi:hypothetical protein|nr:FecR domain-containing protein [Chitinispirillales bacterium]